jgi:NAD(P)-dependent dehydrogenase (short-subunit alcohol dehydrogenase family)
VAAWTAGFGTYGAAKAELIAITNTLRLDLAAQGTQVMGVQLAYTDTDLVRHLEVPKNEPRAVARDIVTAGEEVGGARGRHQPALQSL